MNDVTVRHGITLSVTSDTDTDILHTAAVHRPYPYTRAQHGSTPPPRDTHPLSSYIHACCTQPCAVQHPSTTTQRQQPALGCRVCCLMRMWLCLAGHCPPVLHSQLAWEPQRNTGYCRATACHTTVESLGAIYIPLSLSGAHASMHALQTPAALQCPLSLLSDPLPPKQPHTLSTDPDVARLHNHVSLSAARHPPRKR